jgi:aminocarboxymuconate-semialdehyde decarboxylase
MRQRAIPRREFLAFIGTAASLTTALGARSARAQTVDRMERDERLKVIDFHNHFVGHAFTPKVGTGAPAAMKPYFDEVNRKLVDSRALLSSMDQAGVSARVVNTPLEFMQDPDADVLPGTVERINDQLADLVSRNPGRLYALATVDAYSGEAGARELIRTVRELGLRGVFVASAKGDLLLDAPQARPTLAAAAELGVPVFAHPITDAQMRKRIGRYGRPGTTLNRGTVNSATLLALVEGGIFEELPNLRIVVSTLAIGGILLAAGFAEGKLREDGIAVLRRHVYIDTMRLNSVLLRAAVDVLGVSNVLAGTDWPIYTETKIPERLGSALAEIGLGPAEQRMIASENTTKLLRLG